MASPKLLSLSLSKSWKPFRIFPRWIMISIKSWSYNLRYLYFGPTWIGLDYRCTVIGNMSGQCASITMKSCKPPLQNRLFVRNALGILSLVDPAWSLRSRSTSARSVLSPRKFPLSTIVETSMTSRASKLRRWLMPNVATAEHKSMPATRSAFGFRL